MESIRKAIKAQPEIYKKNYMELACHRKSVCSSEELIFQTWKLVPKKSFVLVNPLLWSVIYRMRMKSSAIGLSLPMFQSIDKTLLTRPTCPRTQRRRRNNLMREGVSDEELCLELQSVVEQNSAVLGESCVNSIVKILDRFKDICMRLKESERRKEEFEEERVRAGLQNLELRPRSENLEWIPPTEDLDLTRSPDLYYGTGVDHLIG